MRERRAGRWIEIRVGLFFIAATVWIVGVALDSDIVRWVGLGLAFFVLILGMYVRMTGSPDETTSDPDR